MLAQAPVAAFTASKTTGCAPLAVTFTDQSTGNPKLWSWDFGNGSLSNLQNPTISFAAPGIYTVKLVVKNPDGVDGVTKTNYITVYPSPNASFTVNSNIGCSPTTFQFTDLSVDPAGTIVKWAWTFSDGTTSTAKNPQVTFNTPGFYDLNLSVTSSTGCTGTNGATRYIRIVPSVKADFTYSQPVTCRAPFAVGFSNQTSGPGTMNYTWNFGNSTTSTNTNDSAKYASAGAYTVTLLAQSSYGCQHSIQKTINVSNTIPSFTNTSACDGLPVSFQNTSSPAPGSIIWKFDDGTQSTLQNPVKTYPGPGSYPVVLVGTYPNCIDSVTKNITINPKPIVNFTAPVVTACKPNLDVNFQDISPDAKSWKWDFGDGSATSTQQNPIHKYTSQGSFRVTLTIVDSKGCENTLSIPNFVRIMPPVASVSNIPAGGCNPFVFKPVSSSFSPDGIQSYSWDFGDGSPIDNTPNPTHTYNGTNNYSLTLTVTSFGGCTNTVSIPAAVKVGDHALADFTKNVSPVCRSSSVIFNYTTTPPGLPVIWDFGDGDTSTKATPSHQYHDTGTYTVQLITDNNGCQDTVTKAAFIQVLPPVARFNYTVDCATKSLVNFRDSSAVDPSHPNTYTWHFGDPANSTASGRFPAFSYPNAWPTDYQVQLVVDDGTCIDSVTHTVRMLNETPDFAINKPIACRNDTIVLIAANMPANVKKYEWAISGRPTVNSPASYYTTFPDTGDYTIQLILTDINDCVTTSVAKTVSIRGPKADFSVLNNGGCKDSLIRFTDQSTSTGTVNNWKWDFGDGSAVSALQNPTHAYANTGIYIVSLTVKDNLGCSNTYNFNDTITRPLSAFRTDTTLFCPGAPMLFLDSSQGMRIISWAWDFGDGGSSSLENPLHTYTGGDSVYTIKLRITDAFACSDDSVRTRYVTIKKPKPAFSVKDSTTICPPLETQFFFQGKDYQSFSWDFGDGGTSALQNPTHFYNNYGVDTVKLYLVGYGGCLDSATSVVHIHDPYTETIMNYGPPLTACNELNVDFTLTIPSSTHMYFYFGDGVIDSSQQTQFQHLYAEPSYNSPALVLTDGQGCLVNIGGPNSILVLGAKPIYGLDKKKFCDSGVVTFTNYTFKNDPIMGETWNFGDGTSTFNNTNPPADAIHNFQQPGLYVIKLTDSTQAGCVKSYTDSIYVLRTPDPSINSVATACINNTVSFEGLLAVPDTAITWKWDFGNGQTSALEKPVITYTQAGNYTVQASATNSLGCKDTTSTTIVVNTLPAITVTGDTSLLVGMGITMPVSYSPNAVSYSWTPADYLSCTDCPTPYANPKFNTTYQVTVTDANNCTISRLITLITLCNNKNFFIPNTFSPNRDGNNDIFYPRGTGIDRIQAMRIFNRWGEPVFEKRFFPANDPGSGWDGTYKGKPASTDTYIYMIDIICENATIITYKGNVTLIR